MRPLLSTFLLATVAMVAMAPAGGTDAQNAAQQARAVSTELADWVIFSLVGAIAKEDGTVVDSTPDDYQFRDAGAGTTIEITVTGTRYVTRRSVEGDSAVDQAVQEEELESILDEVDHVPVISSNSADGHRGGLLSLLGSPFPAVHAAAQANASSVHLLITSLGVSTGDALTVEFVNQGPTITTLPRGSVTLRPLKKAAADRAVRAFKQLRGRRTTLKLYGYCLNFKKLVPEAGTVYEVAPSATQRRNQRVREILRSVTALDHFRLMHPEGDRRQYLHSIRQWAVWTREQNFTESTFTRAMLDHARKNRASQNGSWTKDIESSVRASAAKRWIDITMVLNLADRVADRRATPER